MKSKKSNQLVRWLPYVVLIGLLVVLYIGNVHSVQKKIRLINNQHKEIEALKREYYSIKKRSLYEGTLNQVIKDIDGIDIKDKVPVPKKIDNKDA
jgi:hypothetical protein